MTEFHQHHISPHHITAHHTSPHHTTPCTPHHHISHTSHHTAPHFTTSHHIPHHTHHITTSLTTSHHTAPHLATSHHIPGTYWQPCPTGGSQFPESQAEGSIASYPPLHTELGKKFNLLPTSGAEAVLLYHKPCCRAPRDSRPLNPRYSQVPCSKVSEAAVQKLKDTQLQVQDTCAEIVWFSSSGTPLSQACLGKHHRCRSLASPHPQWQALEASI